MADRLLGVFRDQSLEFGLGALVLEVRLPRAAEDPSELGPAVGGVHIDDPHHLNSWPGRINQEQPRGLATLNTAPELFLGRQQEVLAKTIDEITADLRHAFNLVYKEYFLFFSALEPKKNLSRLVDAYAVSGARYPLVIAGGLGWQYESDLERINDDRFLSYRMNGRKILPERHVRRLSYVPFPQLVSIIRGARAVLFPSLYEGFGLPVLEAMLLGTPVMTSKVASLPEVAGDAALLVDPTDTEQMAAAIRKLDQDGDLRAELSERGRERAKLFSPEIYRERLTKLYGRISA